MLIKLLNPQMRQLAKLNSLRVVSLYPREFSTTSVSQSKNLRVWRPFDDSIFDFPSRFIRELDWANRNIGANQWFPAIEKTMKGLNDLVVTDKDGNRKFQLILELGDFKPEEIKVKTHGRSLNISAKKETQVSLASKKYLT